MSAQMHPATTVAFFSDENAFRRANQLNCSLRGAIEHRATITRRPGDIGNAANWPQKALSMQPRFLTALAIPRLWNYKMKEIRL